MEATATVDGVFFGTWGLTRMLGPLKTQWDKFDGRLYGLTLSDGEPLFPPVHPGITPYAYKYGGRPALPQDRPAGPGLHLNYFNGTIEGTGAADPQTGRLYFGRGDGLLYAMDMRSGAILWRFRTFDPERPDDPEGGGEIVAGPLPTSRGLVVATFAAPATAKPPREVRIETNAVFLVGYDGKPIWRYPGSGTLPNPFVAPPALSPDGTRVYVASELIDPAHACELTALSLASGKPVWTVPLESMGAQDMAVGPDGVVYLTGMVKSGPRVRPAAMAYVDAGLCARKIWGPLINAGLKPQSQLGGGVALMERDNRVETVFVSTTNVRALLDTQPSGALYALEPGSGKIKASWSPESASPPSSGGLTDVSLDNTGVVYVGVRGRTKLPGRKESNGRMYALSFNGQIFSTLWSQEADGQIDWASPAIGPDGGLYFGSTSRMSPINQIVPHRPNADVPDSNPTFYGIHDSSPAATIRP